MPEEALGTSLMRKAFVFRTKTSGPVSLFGHVDDSGRSKTFGILRNRMHSELYVYVRRGHWSGLGVRTVTRGVHSAGYHQAGTGVTRSRDFTTIYHVAVQADVTVMLRNISLRTWNLCCKRPLSTNAYRLPSYAYTSPSHRRDAATQTTPSDLTPSERRALEDALRVDQAGEIAANYIYQGQLAVLGGDKNLGALIQVSSVLSSLSSF